MACGPSRKVPNSLPLSASQSSAVRPNAAVRTRRPSGLKTALTTQLVWHWKVAKSLPLTSQSEEKTRNGI